MHYNRFLHYIIHIVHVTFGLLNAFIQPYGKAKQLDLLSHIYSFWDVHFFFGICFTYFFECFRVYPYMSRGISSVFQFNYFFVDANDHIHFRFSPGFLGRTYHSVQLNIFLYNILDKCIEHTSSQNPQ